MRFNNVPDPLYATTLDNKFNNPTARRFAFLEGISFFFFVVELVIYCQLVLRCYIILAVTAMELAQDNQKDTPGEVGSTAEDAGARGASTALDLVIDLLEDVQKVISGGKPKRMKIRFGNRVIADMPVALTAAAAFAAGLAAVLLTKLAIEVEHEN